MLPKLPLDIQLFRTLRTEGYVYVDKTRYAYSLITGGKRFFLARPRRFGKSLFVSTLHEILSGNRELFEGLWISSSDYHWKNYAVIWLDFSRLSAESSADFKESLIDELQRNAKEYGIAVEPSDNISITLAHLLGPLKTKFQRVAILIDEYDRPILHHLHASHKAESIHFIMEEFLTMIKASEQFVDFVFITGVATFTKSGIFSGINNLQVISLDEHYAGICGYSDAEIDTYFKDFITQWAHEKNISYEEIRNGLRRWYNGYHFSEVPLAVYNPFSCLYAFAKKAFDSYWFNTGIPTFLMHVLKNSTQDGRSVIEVDTWEVSQRSLEIADVHAIPLPGLLFQTGYLTIKNFNPESNLYTLRYANEETKSSLQEYFLQVLVHTSFETVQPDIYNFRKNLQRGDVAESIIYLKRLLMRVPYHIHDPQEKFYHALLHIICVVAGVKVHSEYSISHGRIDLVIELPQLLYIIEIKFNKSPEQALQQTEDRRHYEPFVTGNVPIILVGLSFIREPHHFDIQYVYKTLSHTSE